MLKRLLLTALLALCLAPTLLAQEAKVELSAANFPDAEFRSYLKGRCASAVSTANGKTYIDRTAVNEINLNFSDGTVNSVKVNYTKIKSLEGIKLFVNLQTLTLPAISKTSTYALGDIDVSGMPNLSKITNGTAKYTVNASGTKNAAPNPATKFKISLKKLVADDCPRLAEVYLMSYKTLEEVSFEGTTGDALKNLFVTNTGLRRLDISNLPNLVNEGSWLNFLDSQFADAIGETPLQAMTHYSTFAVDNCSELTEFIIGSHQTKFLSVNYCDKLTTLDISGLGELVRFYGTFHTTTATTSYGGHSSSDKYTCNHVYNMRSQGQLASITFGQDYPLMRYFTCKGGVLTNAGIAGIEVLAPGLQHLDLSYNKLTAFDVSPFRMVTYLDLGYNRIHHLDLPPNKSITSLGISDNCLTRMDQFKPGGKLVYSQLARINPFQYIRVGDAWRYRVLDDPADAQYIETADDLGNQKYYWAIHGGHMGNPENDELKYGTTPTGRKEDPCYFYFDSPLTDGQYWYRNPYTKTDHFVHTWIKVTLCKGADEVDFDKTRTFYLSGEFNNWQPTERHAFVYNPSTDTYELLVSDVELRGDFRIWDDMDPAKVSVNLGGHADEKDQYDGHGDHIFFAPTVKHKVDTDESRNFSTFKQGETDENGGGYMNPLIEMRYNPGDDANNYVRVIAGTPTSADITLDDSDAPVELFDMRGFRVDPASAAAGVYVRRQGRQVSKVVIR